MQNFLSRFYLLSKLGTSLILISVLIFLGYLFFKSYTKQENITNLNFNIGELENEISKLNNLVANNSSNIKSFGNSIDNNNKLYNEISKNLENINSDKNTENLSKQISVLLNENEKLKKTIYKLSNDINSINNNEVINDTSFLQENQIIESLTDLIQLNIENGRNFRKETKLLYKHIQDVEKKAYIDKLLVLSDKSFISIKEIKISFDAASSQYIKNYLKNKNNKFYNYFLSFVSIKPNLKNKNDLLSSPLSEINDRIIDKDFESALNKINNLEENNVFFEELKNDLTFHLSTKECIKNILK